MSIAKEIGRLQTAKADLKTAIENKGVRVSSSALLDDYPALIDSIPSGGDSNVSFVKVSDLIQGDNWVLELSDYGNGAIVFYKGSGVSSTKANPPADLYIKFAGATVCTLNFNMRDTILGIITEPTGANGTRTVYYSNSLTSESFTPRT